MCAVYRLSNILSPLSASIYCRLKLGDILICTVDALQLLGVAVVNLNQLVKALCTVLAAQVVEQLKAIVILIKKLGICLNLLDNLLCCAVQILQLDNYRGQALSGTICIYIVLRDSLESLCALNKLHNYACLLVGK